MLTAAEVSAAAQVTAENWPGYAGCVALVLFIEWADGTATSVPMDAGITIHDEP